MNDAPLKMKAGAKRRTKKSSAEPIPFSSRRRFAIGPRTLVWLLLVLAVIWRWGGPTRDSIWSLSSAEAYDEGIYRVVRVIDGDTLIVSPRKDESEITIRLLGINAPENTTKREPFGEEATSCLRELVAGGEVRLEWD